MSHGWALHNIQYHITGRVPALVLLSTRTVFFPLSCLPSRTWDVGTVLYILPQNVPRLSRSENRKADVLLGSKQTARLGWIPTMSKRKWDQTGEPSEEGPSKVSKTEDGKTATEAAAVAVRSFRAESSRTTLTQVVLKAAIAAKIAAQFTNKDTPPPPPSSTPAPPPPAPSGRPELTRGLNVTDERKRDPHDAEFTYDIEINDVRNRYMLTKGSTQQEVIASSSSVHTSSIPNKQP